MKKPKTQQPGCDKAGKPRKMWASPAFETTTDPILSRRKGFNYVVPVLVLPCDAASVAVYRKKIAGVLCHDTQAMPTYGDMADTVLAALGLGKKGK